MLQPDINHQFEVTPTNRNINFKCPFLAKVTIATNADQNTSTNDELLFVEQNDVVAIQQKIDEKWFLAQSEEHCGRLLVSACRPLDNEIPVSLCQYLIDNQFYDLHVCFASFVAQDFGDLSLTKGDIIVAINQVNEHWMQGQVCFDSQANNWPKLELNKQIGTFPLNHCWKLGVERVKIFCHDTLQQTQKQQQNLQKPTVPLGWAVPNVSRKPLLSTAHSSSLSSGSSSLYSTDYQQTNNYQQQRQQQQQQQQQHDTQDNRSLQPPPRPQQLPRQIAACHKSVSEQAVAKPGLLTCKQQDKLKGWLHTVKKKTARLSTKITASLGLISLTRDEEFERHYGSFKHIEKTIRAFIKNLTTFVEHFESFLLALQNTSENLANFYRDKSHQKELIELRRKNKALACEHFHAFKRTVDRQVIAVASQLLQKFSGPRQLITKRSAKLLDYDTKTKEMESCRDLEKKAALRDQYVIAKDLYDRINGQLIEELPLFNQFALDIFRECVLVLLESRRTLILSYTKQTASLLETPLMASYTASDVASTILMSCEDQPVRFSEPRPSDLRSMLDNQDNKSGQTSEHGGTQQSGSAFDDIIGDDHLTRPHSVASQLSSDFDQMALAAREISSTPLSHVSEFQAGTRDPAGSGSVRFVDEPDGVEVRSTNGMSDNKQNEDIEAAASAARANNELFAQPQIKEENPQKDKSRKKRKSPIYIASWPFVATGPNQLTIACNQPLKLIKGCDECGNSDWSLVKDKRGQLGYVPTSYIKAKE